MCDNCAEDRVQTTYLHVWDEDVKLCSLECLQQITRVWAPRKKSFRKLAKNFLSNLYTRKV